MIKSKIDQTNTSDNFLSFLAALAALALGMVIFVQEIIMPLWH